MESNIHYTIGLMSGTSMDGTDAVCVRFVNHNFDKVIAHQFLSFDEKLRYQLLSLQNISNDEINRTRQLAQTLTYHYAEVVHNLLQLDDMKNIPIEAIACHGQTIRHAPQLGYSVQLADWALLAEITRLPVVGDFRATDIAAGGQGAPLVPIFHHQLFFNHEQTRAVVNIGGIANLTVLHKDGTITGFDTGPGNMLIDEYCRLHFACDYDDNGEIAQQGEVLEDLLKLWLQEDYFALSPPKSTGRDLFSFAWAKHVLRGDENPYNVLRTITELTAISIADAVKKYADDSEEVLLCGGGTYNSFLCNRIATLLPNQKICDTTQYGLSAMYVESSAFAWFAHCRVHKIALNLSNITGSKGKRVLGAMWDCISTE